MTAKELKFAAKSFITLWCLAIAENDGDNFEKKWDLQARDEESVVDKESPVKKLKIEGSAVAAMQQDEASDMEEAAVAGIEGVAAAGSMDT